MSFFIVDIAKLEKSHIFHKISVFFGFSNNIDPKEIGKIDNLCICSRWSNHRKGIMNEEKFIEYLNENNFFNEK